MLNAHETLLIETLRSLPAERQACLAKGCAKLLDVAEHAGACPGPGVDGFPCGEPQASCEYCFQLVHALEAMSH